MHEGTVRRQVMALALGALASLASQVAATGTYFQTVKPRPQLPCHRGGPCGSIGQTIILADHPRQAAMAALRDPRIAAQLAENAYSAADEAEQLQLEACVDLYFETVAFSWHFLQWRDAAAQPDYERCWQVYHSGLARLLESAQRFGRWQAGRGLQVNTSAGRHWIGVRYQGFVWQPADFNRIELVQQRKKSTLEHHYRCDGFGVPLVFVRQRGEDERFFQREIPFAATAVLRPSMAVLAGRAPPAGHGSLSHGPLELYDPLRVGTVAYRGQLVPLAGDLSEPFETAAFLDRENPLKATLRPGAGTLREKLFMIQPYQPGKYPIVFIHGLLSSPQVWRNLANEILARPALRSRFQVWGFQYPTGRPFLRPAAELRKELNALVDTLDPQDQDHALSQMVLIGHSMGGLIAKLVATSSEDKLWYSVANRPIHRLNATESQRQELRELFCFQPLPFVTRVVFVGTPHDGSSLASRAVGRCSDCLVQQPTDQVIKHRVLIGNNPDVFSPELERGIPTSIDLLEPSSRILQAIQQLCPGPHVQFHSIIGTGCPGPLAGPGDGAVPVSSAHHPCVSSERLIHTRHGKLHDHPEAVEEIFCILRRHLWEAGECGSGGVGEWSDGVVE